MALIERTPNQIFGSRLVGKFLSRPNMDRNEFPAPDATEVANDTGDDIEVHEVASDELNFGDQASARRLAKLIAAADSELARVIGIAGARRGAGASFTSRQLAGAYAGFGRETLLVNASRIPQFSDDRPSASTEKLLQRADEIRPALSYIDLAATIGDDGVALQEFTETLISTAQAGQTVIVDLPPIVSEDGRPNMAIRDLGVACDLIFLVCPTGEMRRKELSECIETCRVVGVEVNGLILNDWHMLASGLLES